MKIYVKSGFTPPVSKNANGHYVRASFLSKRWYNACSQALSSGDSQEICECIYDLLDELCTINEMWYNFIGDVRDYEMNGLFQEEGLVDIAYDCLENIEDGIWEADGVMNERNLLEKLLKRLYPNG